MLFFNTFFQFLHTNPWRGNQKDRAEYAFYSDKSRFMQGYLYTVKKMITDIKNRSTYTVQKVKDVFSVFPKWLFGFIQHDNGNQKKQTEKQFDKPEHNHIFRRYTENFVHYYHRPDRNQKLFCCKRISSFHCCPLQKNVFWKSTFNLSI